jgi:RHS repeat-associated protein
VDATGSFTKYIYANGQRVAQRKDDAVISYLLTDPLGSTAITANTAGVETAELRYNPWGKERASGFDASLTPTDYRFTDQRIETSFGLYHYDARWFDPTYGRFVQADTLIQDIRNPQLLDRYAYTLNNPVKYSDPTGHLVCSEVPWEEGCQMTEGQEDLMLATREYHKMSYEGRSAFQAYKYMATHDGWWNENDGDFTFEDFMGITLLNEMGTEVNALNKMIDANTNQLWMNAHEGGGHDAYCKTSPCYAGALNFLSQSHSFWGRYHAWKSTGEIGKPNRYGKNYNEYDIGASLLTFDVSRTAYNPDAAYNWGNDANWAAAIDAALAGNPVEKIIGYAPSQIVYYNPIGDFIIFTIGQVSYWR